jgi:hypothetical protein
MLTLYNEPQRHRGHKEKRRDQFQVSLLNICVNPHLRLGAFRSGKKNQIIW